MSSKEQSLHAARRRSGKGDDARSCCACAAVELNRCFEGGSADRDLGSPPSQGNAIARPQRKGLSVIDLSGGAH
jgi:hypothetical protein